MAAPSGRGARPRVPRAPDLASPLQHVQMAAPRRDRAEVAFVQQTSAFEPTQRVQTPQLRSFLLLELAHGKVRRHHGIARRATHRVESREIRGVIEEREHARDDDVIGKARNGLGLHGAVATARLLSAKICRLIGRYDQKTNGRRFIRAVSKRRGERASLDPPRRSPRAPARCPRRRSRSEAHQRPDSHRTSARDDRRDGAPRRRAAHAVPRESRDVPRDIPRLGIPDASRGRFVVPGLARHARGVPRARANPADAPGASAAPENAERLFLPGEARNGSRSSRAVGSAGSDAKRHPSFKKTHWVKDKDAKACGHKPCSRPFTVLLRRHHCRACGLVFCARCVETRLLLDPQTAEPVTRAAAAAAGTKPGVFFAARVCVRCYERAFEAAEAAAKREGTREGTRVASEASEASEASSSSHVEEHRNTAFSVSETTSFGSAETRAREAFLSAPFSRKKHPTPKEKKRAFRRRLRARKRPTPRKKASAARSLQAVGR